MVRIRYLQHTHDSRSGEVKFVDDQCARVLVLLGKAEYATGKRSGNRKKKTDAEGG